MPQLSVREKEHWKNRISSRIDKRIDALGRVDGFMNQVLTKAKAQVFNTAGLNKMKKQYDGLENEIIPLQEKVDAKIELLHQLRRNILAQLTNKELNSISNHRYSVESELEDCLVRLQEGEVDSILSQSKYGREILALRQEKENLLDTVWLATSGSQIKELWQHANELLEEEPTTLQKNAQKITPVESD